MKQQISLQNLLNTVKLTTILPEIQFLKQYKAKKELQS